MYNQKSKLLLKLYPIDFIYQFDIQSTQCFKFDNKLPPP